MAIARLLLLFVGVAAQQYAVTPPNIRPPTEQRREQHGAEHSLPLIINSIKILAWSWGFLEGSVLFALSGYCPPALARPFLHAVSPTVLTLDLTALTPTFLTGIILTLAGALLRAHCFRTLGKQFTFELSIRPTHALVTEGVYSVIRHPSYTGFLAHMVGYVFCVLDQRGPVVSVWMRLAEASVFGGDGSGHTMAMGVWVCMCVTGLGLLWGFISARMDNEDAMLEKNFGEEWRAWTKRVPYRLIPGVY